MTNLVSNLIISAFVTEQKVYLFI